MKREGISWVVGWASAGIAFAVFLVLGFFGGFGSAGVGGGPLGLFSYYVQAFGFSLFECLDQLALIAFVFVVFLAFYGIMRRFLFLFLESVDSPWAKRINLRGSPWKVVRETARKLGAVLLDVLPAMILLLVLSLVFSEANGLDKTRLFDVSVIGWERFVAGTYVFAWLATIVWPHWLIAFVISCFLNVATIVILPALFVGYVTPRVFREMTAAFAIGMTILMFCWLAVPALSPQDRFVDDVYRLPVTANIAAAVAGYHPQPEIQAFLTNIRTGKESLPNLPTTTIPSAHIFWLGLAAYYFFKSKKWLGWITLPFIVASAFGTVLLAQHYLLDVVASVVVVGISILFTRCMMGLYS